MSLPDKSENLKYIFLDKKIKKDFECKNQKVSHLTAILSLPFLSPFLSSISSIRSNESVWFNKGVKLALQINQNVLCNTIDILVNIFFIVEYCEFEIFLL